MTEIEVEPSGLEAWRSRAAELPGVSVVRHYIEVGPEIGQAVRAEIETMPGGEALSLEATKLANVGRAFKSDINEKSWRERGYAFVNGLGIVAVVGIGGSRLPSALALPLALEVYQRTGNLLAAMAATWAASGTWSGIDARTLDGGVNRLPQAFTAASRLSVTSKLSDTLLPGLEPRHTPSTIREQVSTRLARSVTISGPGIISYVMAAALQNQSKAERRGLCRNLAIDSGWLWSVLALAATTAISSLEQHHPDTAATIANTANDSGLMLKLVWGYATARIIGKIVKDPVEKAVTLTSIACTLAARRPKKQIRKYAE